MILAQSGLYRLLYVFRVTLPLHHTDSVSSIDNFTGDGSRIADFGPRQGE